MERENILFQPQQHQPPMTILSRVTTTGVGGGWGNSNNSPPPPPLQQQQQQQQTLNLSPTPLQVPHTSPTNEYLDMVIGNKYQIGQKIGNGSFGEIYHAINILTKEDVAIKIEKKIRRKVIDANNNNPNNNPNNHNNHNNHVNSNHYYPSSPAVLPTATADQQQLQLQQQQQQYQYHESRHSQLKREAKIYSMLHGEAGIPKIRWFGVGTEKNWLVMDLLGRSLEDLFNYCHRKFSFKTVLVLAYELMCRIETIHTKGKLVHRDIKPENFLMGRGRDRHTVYIIDFGLAKLYQNPRTGKHIQRKHGYSLTGTARYASVNAHLGHELSRRDDLISIGYVLVYFLKGILPWQGLHGKTNEEKYKLIFEKKSTTTLEELCRDLPEEFLTYFLTVTSLEFDQTPDYNLLKNIFRQLFVQNQYVYDNILYDWEVIAAKGKK